MTDDDPDLARIFAAIDQPEPLPSEFAARLRGELLEAFDERIDAIASVTHSTEDAVDLELIDPAPLPARPDTAGTRGRGPWVWLAAAAAVVVVLAIVVSTGRQSDSTQNLATEAATVAPTAPGGPIADPIDACAVFRRDGLGDATRAATIGNTEFVDQLDLTDARQLLEDLAAALPMLAASLGEVDGVSTEGLRFVEQAGAEARRIAEVDTTDVPTARRALEQVENLLALAEPLLAPSVGVGCVG